MENNLEKYGWNYKWQKIWDSHNLPTDYMPARVIADYGKSIQVTSDNATYLANTGGKMTYELKNSQLPKVGDWVAISLRGQDAKIHLVLERLSHLARRSAGQKNDEQILATNINLALVVQSMDDDLNINRLKRYLFQLGRSSIKAIVIINKIDKDADWKAKILTIKQAVPGIDIVAMQATNPESIDIVREKIPVGASVVIIGSSGVGKSTIVNGLLGFEKQKTQEVRLDDSKGRHTTTHREMFVLPNGALLIDTPGIREIQLWGTLDDIQHIDENITKLAADCKYSNCSHGKESGCRIIQAISDGGLNQTDLDSYNKIKQELEDLDTKLGTATRRSVVRKNLHKKQKSKTIWEDD